MRWTVTTMNRTLSCRQSQISCSSSARSKPDRRGQQEQAPAGRLRNIHNKRKIVNLAWCREFTQTDSITARPQITNAGQLQCIRSNMRCVHRDGTQKGSRTGKYIESRARVSAGDLIVVDDNCGKRLIGCNGDRYRIKSIAVVRVTCATDGAKNLVPSRGKRNRCRCRFEIRKVTVNEFVVDDVSVRYPTYQRKQ